MYRELLARQQPPPVAGTRESSGHLVLACNQLVQCNAPRPICVLLLLFVDRKRPGLSEEKSLMTC